MTKSSRKPSRGNPGKLVPGAGGGPQPGAGRPTNMVRELARGAYLARLPILEQIADGAIDNVNPRDRIAAMRELRELGFPNKLEIGIDTEAKNTPPVSYLALLGVHGIMQEKQQVIDAQAESNEIKLANMKSPQGNEGGGN